MMSGQLAVSLENYKKGLDEILARKEKEYNRQMESLNHQVSFGE